MTAAKQIQDAELKPTELLVQGLAETLQNTITALSEAYVRIGELERTVAAHNAT